MRIAIVLGAGAVALAACARHAAVHKVGPETYRTSVNASAAVGAPARARELALSDASGMCASLGRDLEVIEIRSDDSAAAATATVTFKCPARIHR